MDGARFDRWTRALASRRGLLRGLTTSLGALALGESGASAARCKALGQPCRPSLAECCSQTCTRPAGPDGRPRGRPRCLCRQTLELPCGGRCCSRNQTCKRGRCVHHCRDGRINFDESDQDCGGDDCPKCALFRLCDRPSDCQSGRCRVHPAFDAKTRCVECVEDGDCRDATKPRCNTAINTCVQCVTEEHCLDEAAPICHDVTGRCVQCQDELDCPRGQLCEGGRCAGNTCGADQNICQNFIQGCNGNSACLCYQTTSGESFCGNGFRCSPCAVDSDCTAEFGPGAACVDMSGPQCDGCGEVRTACLPPCPATP